MKDPAPLRSVIQIVLLSFLTATACKILLFPSYRSSDFNVHRHWKAVTRHLPMKEWYFDDMYVSTRHTLDYPPGFAFLESFFANNAVTNLLIRRNILDDACLRLWSDLDVEQALSDRCVAFMRSTVIAGDLVLWLGACSMAAVLSRSGTAPQSKGVAVFLLVVLNPGLIWLDHVHFQYNGLLLGVLLLSIACLMQANVLDNQSKGSIGSDVLQLVGAALFAILLTMKHLYMTLALWYFAYLLRRFCFVGGHFSGGRLLLLAVLTVHCLLTPFLPLLMTSPQPLVLLRQIFMRLFPFGRGLVHDYWAGNIWAVYTATSKVTEKLFRISLPNVPPALVAIIMLTLLSFGALYAWKAAARRDNSMLLLSITYSALASFLTGYHVHEKAIMTTIVPLTFLAGFDQAYAWLLWETTAWGLLGLFPLLFEPREMLLKLTSYLAFMAAMYWLIPPDSTDWLQATWLGISMIAIAGVWLMLEVVPMSVWGRLEFIPLAVVSLSCAMGLLQCFLRLTLAITQVYQLESFDKVARSKLDEGAVQNEHEEDEDDVVPPVRVIDDQDTSEYEYLLSRKVMQQVAEKIIPRGITYCPWKRLYRLSRDGDSFQAFMQSVKGHSRTLLVIRTTRGALMGAFADAEWQSTPRFFGGPSACLYRIANDGLVAYKWSGANRYIQLCDASNQRIAFGGGSEDQASQGAFGLLVERHFQIGTTDRCVTFDNEPLCDETSFAIEDMEVFGFLVGQF